MPLGYGYVERDATSFVDWGTIGKNLSDMLQNENKVREEKKAAIDKATNEYANTLANAPQGEHIGMNEWALKYANDAQQARLLQDKLLKSGQLSLKDYTIQRQNLLDGTDQTFNLTKEYQQEYKTKMEAYKNGETQGLTNFLMASAEGFSNFSDTQIYINPRDYSISVGKMTRNPKTGVMEMSKNPNDFATINSLRNRIKATYKKYDAVGNVKGFVDGLGAEIQSVANMGGLYKTGTIVSTLDVMKKSNLPAYKTFEQAETEAIKARLGTQYDYTSVLTENIKSAPNGKIYDYTFDENEAKSNKNLILLKTDPSSGAVTPQLTSEQESSVIEYMRTEARLMYDKKVEIKETSQLSRNEKSVAGRQQDELDKSALNFGEMLGDLVTGEKDKKNRAAEYFKSVEGVDDIVSDDKGMSVYLTDKDEPLRFNYGSDSPKKFAASIVKALNKEGLSENLILNSAYSKVGGKGISTEKIEGGEETITPNVNEKFNKRVDVINPRLFYDKNNKQTLKTLKSYLSGIPSITYDADTFGNNITIKYGEDTVTINTNQGSEEDAKNESIKLSNWLKGLPEVSKKSWLQSKFPSDLTETKKKRSAGGGKGELD